MRPCSFPYIVSPASLSPEIARLCRHTHGLLLSFACLQGLKPLVSTEAPPIIFATPTKLTSSPAAYDYAGKNRVPELQKFFQVSEDPSRELGCGDVCVGVGASETRVYVSVAVYPVSFIFN